MYGDAVFVIGPLVMIAFVLVVAVELVRKLPGLVKARERAATTHGQVLEIQPGRSRGVGENAGDRQHHPVKCSYAVKDRTFAGSPG